MSHSHQHSSHHSGDHLPGKFVASQAFKTTAFVCAFLGLLTLIVGLWKEPQRVWTSYLVSFWFFFSLGMGGLFFAAINHIAKAGWSVGIRRFAEALTSFLPVAFVLGLGFYFGMPHLYDWLRPEIVAKNHLLQLKTPYLNAGFFGVRLVGFFVIWLIFSHFIVGRSLKQDHSGDHSLTLKNVATSVQFVLFFAISYSLFSVDLLMSLLPHWYSTIYGVYTFAGMFQSSLSAIIVITLWLKKQNLIHHFVKADHTHDLGKYLKAFTVFWAYIAFSQFLLIWYANIPEETEFFLDRVQNGWIYVSASLVIFKFAVPFLALLPRAAKRSENYLMGVCFLILGTQYLDVYWLVYPNFNNNHLKFSLYEIGIFLGFLGLFLWRVQEFLSKNSLIPIKDPRLPESMDHHVTY